MAIRDNILTRETLNLIMLLDNSGSMAGERIDQLNQAMPKIQSDLLKMADSELVDINIRVISFSFEPTWEIGRVEMGEDIHSVVWHNLNTIGATNTEKAIREANKCLKKEYLGSHALRPVVVLVTDGGCNGPYNEFLNEVEKMKTCLSGSSRSEKVTRIAIGVNDYNREELEAFASVGLIHDQKQPLVFEIDNSSDLGKVINWVTVTSMYSSITNMEEDIVDLGDAEWSEDDFDDDIV